MLNVFQRLAEQVGRIAEQAQSDIAGMAKQRPNLASLVAMIYRKHRRTPAQYLAFNPAANGANPALRVVHTLILFKRDSELTFNRVALARQRFDFLAPPRRNSAFCGHIADLTRLAPRLRTPVLVAVEVVNWLCLSAARACLFLHSTPRLWLHYAELYHIAIVNASDSYITQHGPRWLLRTPTGAATWHASEEAAMMAAQEVEQCQWT